MIPLLAALLSQPAVAGCGTDLTQDLNCNTVDVLDEGPVDLTDADCAATGIGITLIRSRGTPSDSTRSTSGEEITVTWCAMRKMGAAMARAAGKRSSKNRSVPCEVSTTGGWSAAGGHTLKPPGTHQWTCSTSGRHAWTTRRTSRRDAFTKRSNRHRAAQEPSACSCMVPA